MMTVGLGLGQGWRGKVTMEVLGQGEGVKGQGHTESVVGARTGWKGKVTMKV